MIRRVTSWKVRLSCCGVGQDREDDGFALREVIVVYSKKMLARPLAKCGLGSEVRDKAERSLELLALG